MKIGELAQIAQCTVETVRYYEKEGLLPAPARTVANYRSYSNAQVDRLRFIRNCRALDMTHEEVRALLGLVDQPENSCSGVNRVLDEHIAHVDVRIRELRLLKEQLVALRETCHSEQPVVECGIVQGLRSMETESKHARQTHLG